MATKKEEYIDKIAGQLKEWSAKIDDLEVKTSGMAANIKTEYEARIRTLQTKRDLLSRRLKEMKESGSGTWNALKAGVEAARNDLRDSIAAMRDKFKKAA